MLFPISNINTEILQDELFDQKQVSLSVIRLDTLHRVVSGNKLFKLHYFLEMANRESTEGIVTFGGAYSNHLVSTAFACREAGLKSTGIVRGERPAILSGTLQECLDYGMTLQFISRGEYAVKDQPGYIQEIKAAYKNHLLVPEGGYHPAGAHGAALILDLVKEEATHICCPVGTATTLSGLLTGIKNNQQVVGFPVLKNMIDLYQRITYLTNRQFTDTQLKIRDNYHFGGYAKKNQELIDSMNQVYLKHKIPTDFVYTGKMMFGVIDCIKKDFFSKGSKIVCIHTGGLQGNNSLPPGTLDY